MEQKFLYKLYKCSDGYILCARLAGLRSDNVVAVFSGNVGSATFHQLADGERVELKEFSVYPVYWDELAPRLLRRLEKIVVRSSLGSVVWLEAPACRRDFFCENGYQMIAEHDDFCYMQKDLKEVGEDGCV